MYGRVCIDGWNVLVVAWIGWGIESGVGLDWDDEEWGWGEGMGRC